MNRFRHLLTVLSFVPVMMLAQSSTENYVRAETMLNADGNNAMVSGSVTGSVLLIIFSLFLLRITNKFVSL